MPKARNKSVSSFRRRLARQGIVRLEVHVCKGDAPLVRGMVKALRDPKRQAETRALLRKRFGSGRQRGLKALLAAAPLDGIDLARERDSGRTVEL